jgi:hypothetical protein
MTDEAKPQSKKPEAAKAASRAQLDLPQGIPVAVMRFLKGTQVPGVATTTELKSHTAGNRRKWDIEFIPQVRHFKITYTPPDVGEPKVMMVHETRVDTWDPAL